MLDGEVHNMTATLTTLASFPAAGLSGPLPEGDLVADAHGDLFGVTVLDGAFGFGMIFEIPKTSSGYGSPITLVSFNGSDGSGPNGGLIMDAHGDLFGTTAGGADGFGTVFEIVKTKTGYSSTPTTLVSFDGSDGAYPRAGLIADSHGDLFGTTQSGGQNGLGTVFEIAKTNSGYSSTPTTLVNFDGSNGGQPLGSLVADNHGNLFGTTQYGGQYGLGTVFEIAKTNSGYSSTPTTLVSFNGSDGAQPVANLILDDHGDLFGTTASGGVNNSGTVFEIVETKSGYASTPTTLVSFNGADGAAPLGGLFADHQGDLFGTTIYGGTGNEGTVFEIVKTKAGYASTPTTLVNFNGTNGGQPGARLIADHHGDLFGTTSGGYPSFFDGTVFEITFGKDNATNITGIHSSLHEDMFLTLERGLQ
jgi:hypothetical protein